MPYNPPTYGETGEVYTDNVRNSLAAVKTQAELAQSTADGLNASVTAASQTADEAKEIAEAAKAFTEAPTDGRVAQLVNDAASETKAALSATFGRVAPAPTGVAASDTAALLALLDVAGDRTTIDLRAGTYVINQPLPLRTGLVWRGQGRTQTVVKVADGANCPAFRTDNFATLTGTSVSSLTATPYGFGIEGLAVDGNKANQTGTSWGIQAYGHSFTLTDLHVRNCKSGGIYNEFSFTGSLATDLGLPSYEPRVEGVDIHHCDGWGWRHRGPTDLLASRVLVWKCGLTGGTGGIWVQTGNGSSFSQVHTYGNVGWSFIADAQVFLTGCQIETGEAITGFLDCGALWLRFDDCSVSGGALYRISAAGVPTDGIGLRLGDSASGKYATRAYVNTAILGFTGADAAHAAVHFSADSNSNITATVGMNHPSGSASATTPITGTPDPASVLRLRVTGSSAVKTYTQNDRGYVGVKAQRTTDMTAIATGTFTNVPFDAADVWDTDQFHDPAGTNTRITVPTGRDGRYRLTAAFSWTTNATGRRSIRIRKNGATILVRDDRAAVSGGPTCQNITVDDAAAVGDYYEVQVFQDSGAGIDSNVANAPVWFAAERLSVS